MRHTIKKSATAFIIGLFSTIAFSQTKNDIVGKWKDEKATDKQLEIYLGKDGKYYGKEISTGKLILNGATYNEKKKTFSGKMTPPDANMTMNATISLESVDKFKIIGKKFIMSKTIYFVRIK
jgi:uncharacterized protein (DUF2147 family)